MSFLSKYSNYIKLLQEQQPGQVEDAAAPDPSAVQQQPEVKPETKQINIAPEGYVNLVKLIAKALVMDISASEIDTLLTGQEVTKENALEMEKGLNAVLRDNEIKSDNMERLQNPNYKKFVDSINEKNFMQKYEKLLSIMKQKSPYIS